MTVYPWSRWGSDEEEILLYESLRLWLVLPDYTKPPDIKYLMGMTYYTSWTNKKISIVILTLLDVARLHSKRPKNYTKFQSHINVLV